MNALPENLEGWRRNKLNEARLRIANYHEISSALINIYPAGPRTWIALNNSTSNEARFPVAYIVEQSNGRLSVTVPRDSTVKVSSLFID